MIYLIVLLYVIYLGSKHLVPIKPRLFNEGGRLLNEGDLDSRARGCLLMGALEQRFCFATKTIVLLHLRQSPAPAEGPTSR
jgi:hypothetical protein